MRWSVKCVCVCVFVVYVCMKKKEKNCELIKNYAHNKENKDMQLLVSMCVSIISLPLY